MEIAGKVKAGTSWNVNKSQDEKGKTDYTKIGKKGQIVVGTITGVSDKISIDFNGSQVQVSKTAVQNAREGEERSFEIKDVTKNHIVLKEVDTQGKTESEKQKMIRTTIDRGQKGLTDNKNTKNATDKEEESDTLHSISERMSEEDCTDLEKEGMSIEKYNLERLDRALERIKQQRQAKREGIAQYVERKEDYQKEIEKVKVHNQIQNIAGVPMAQQIADALLKADLPATEANIKKVSSVMDMAAVTPTMSDAAMDYLLENALEPTVANIYQAQYAGNSSKYSDYALGQTATYLSGSVSYVSDAEGQNEQKLAAWEEIAPQAEKRLKEDGISVTEQVMQQAKWLFERELPINGDTIKELDALEKLKEEYEPEQVLEQITEGMARGQEPDEVSLVTPTMTSVQQALDNFLQQVNEQLEQLPEADLTVSDITKRRQLEEIRLKMTADAAIRLQEKGIDLDVEQIEKVVDELRKMEDSYYRGILQEGGVEESQQNVDLLRDTQDCVAFLKEAPNVILGSTLAERENITLHALQQEGLREKASFDQAETAYETLMTKPDRQLGDSMQKAFQ
ncbi:MAG: hypothetical protein IIY81_08420, partial [Lachnospiraceae bacterium]|nr:hypothetical protein [Lachnospiraceae bacterium]